MKFNIFKRCRKLKNGLTFLFLALAVISYSQPKTNENGYNIFYYTNGQKSSEGNLSSGKPDGFWKTYYENGNN